MKVTDLITLGTKIDVRLSAQLKKQEEGREKAPVYKSRVCDIPSENELEISMPTLGGRMVLFHMGAKCNLIFYTKGGMYTTTATVQRRFRRDNIYLLSMNVTGTVVRFQRREFYRVSYLSELEYRPITMDIARRDSIQEVEYEIEQEADFFPVQQGRILDVSGGGIRFSSNMKLESRGYLLLKFQLKNGLMDEPFTLVAQIISSDKHPKEPDMYINRGQFFFKDLREREKIVRFVFEEERRMRNKGADD
jgi:c-di-GMP-binding flagellar brake protein YcgR